MPTDDDDPRDVGSSLLDAGESFLNALGDGDSGTEWREEVERNLGAPGEVNYDRLITAGIAAGEQVARLREQSRTTPAAVEARAREEGAAAPIETRDVYDTNGEYAGTRLYVSADDADAYLSADGCEVAVRTGGSGKTISLPQPATEVVTDDGPLGGVALFVAYPEGSVLDETPTHDGVEQADSRDPDPDAPDDPPADGDRKWMDESRLDEDADGE
jgi:hypothetical protein